MERFAVATLLGASILWGLSWLPLKYLHELGFDGVPITFWVYTIMFALTLPWVWQCRHELKHYAHILLLVALLGGGAQLAFNTALIYGDVIRVMVLFYLVPLWGVIGGRLFLHERITPLRWLGMGLAIMGAFLVVGGWRALDTPPSWIDGLALLSGFLFAMNNITFRISPKTSVRLKLSAMFLGASVLAAVTLAVTAMGSTSAQLINPEPSAWLVLLGYAAIWLLLANIGTQWAVTHMEAGKSSIIIILELVTAVATASWLLAETLSPVEMVGGILILFAAVLEAKPPNKPVNNAPNQNNR